MGNSTSSLHQTEQTNERSFIRSLGERYPLGDVELRKWVWCHNQLSASAPMPSSLQPSSRSLLASLAVWSTTYGDYNPYSQSSSQLQRSQQTLSNPVLQRWNRAKQVLEAIFIVEKHILPSGLSSRIVHGALGLTVSNRSPKNSKSPSLQLPQPSASREEISSWEESYYSITSSVHTSLSAGKYASSPSSENAGNFFGENSYSTTKSALDSGELQSKRLEQFLEG